MKLKLVGIFVVAVTMLNAADPTTPPRRGPGGPNRPQTAIGNPAMGMGAFERVLTDEQRQKLREHTQANSERARAAQVEAFRLRRELQEAVVTGDVTEAAIKEKSEAIAKLEAESLAARMSAVAKVAATLTPEQKEKIKELSAQARPVRPGLGAGAEAPPVARQPAAPPPLQK